MDQTGGVIAFINKIQGRLLNYLTIVIFCKSHAFGIIDFSSLFYAYLDVQKYSHH